MLFPLVVVLSRFDRVIKNYFKKIDFNKLNINQLESLEILSYPPISGELQILNLANIRKSNT